MRIAKQRGFAVIEVVLIVVILCIIAFVAWRIIEANGDVQNAQNQAAQQSTPANNDATVPEPTNASDLDTLQKQLDTAAVDDDTATQLDAQTTF
jgi:Tfp pilus assembly protein PilV